MKDIQKKSVGLLMLGIILTAVIMLTGIKDLSATYALSDTQAFSLYIPEGTTASPGDKVYVELKTDKSKWEHISISMRSTTSNDSFIIYLKDIKSSNPYFILPDGTDNSSNSKTGVKVGETYEIRSIYLFPICKTNSCKAESYATYKSDDNTPYIDVENKKYVTVKANNEEMPVSNNSMSLEYLKFLNNDVQFGDKVYVDLKYSSTDEIAGCSMWLKDSLGTALYYPLEDFKTKPYFNVGRTPDRNIPLAGTYNVTGLTCFGKEQMYTFNSSDNLAFLSDKVFSEKLAIKDSGNKPINSNFDITYFSLQDTEVSVGDTVNVIMPTNIGVTTVLLTFYNSETNKSLPVYLKGLEKRFFVVPSTVEPGTYELQSIVVNNFEHIYTVINNNGEAQLFEDQHLASNKLNIDFSKKLVIKSAVQNTKTLTINNRDFSEEVKNKIMTLDEDAVITVYTYGATVISKDMFEAIKETRKTLIIEYGESEWVFNGADIENPKSIDVSMIISDITTKNFNKSLISNLPQKSKLLTFSDNGNLPGKVLIRLKSIDLDNLFAEDNLYIYYYDKDNDGLMKVAMEIYINHNSDYVLANKEIKANFVSKDTKDLSLNTMDIEPTVKDDNTTLYYLIGTGIALLVIIITILILKRKKK